MRDLRKENLREDFFKAEMVRLDYHCAGNFYNVLAKVSDDLLDLRL